MKSQGLAPLTVLLASLWHTVRLSEERCSIPPPIPFHEALTQVLRIEVDRGNNCLSFSVGHGNDGGGAPCSSGTAVVGLHHRAASQWVPSRLFPLLQCLWGMGRGLWLEGQDPAEDWAPQTLQPPEVSHCPFLKLSQALTTLPPVSNLPFLLLMHNLFQVSTGLSPVSLLLYFCCQLFALHSVRNLVTLKILTYMYG